MRKRFHTVIQKVLQRFKERTRTAQVHEETHAAYILLKTNSFLRNHCISQTYNMSLEVIDCTISVLRKQVDELEKQKKVIESKNAAFKGLTGMLESLQLSIKNRPYYPGENHCNTLQRSQNEQDSRMLEFIVELFKDMKERIEVLEKINCIQKN